MPQACWKLSILPACQQIATNLPLLSTCNKSVKMFQLVICRSVIELVEIAASLR